MFSSKHEICRLEKTSRMIMDFLHAKSNHVHIWYAILSYRITAKEAAFSFKC